MLSPTEDLSPNTTTTTTKQESYVGIRKGSLGYEMYAKRDIKDGEIIWKEAPLISSYPTNKIDPSLHNSRYAWSIVEQLLKTEHKELRLQLLFDNNYAKNGVNQSWESGDDVVTERLARENQYDVDRVKNIYSIVGTNAITSRTKLKWVNKDICIEDMECYGFFKDLSRINHSCIPNIKLIIPNDQQQEIDSISVVALKNINIGEAIVMDYVQNAKIDERRLLLFKNYGFRCSCEICDKKCSHAECNEVKLLSKCPCHMVKYCSVTCQRKDWKRHKEEKYKGMQFGYFTKPNEFDDIRRVYVNDEFKYINMNHVCLYELLDDDNKVIDKIQITYVSSHPHEKNNNAIFVGRLGEFMGRGQYINPVITKPPNWWW